MHVFAFLHKRRFLLYSERMLFDRKKYKSFARIQLRGRFFIPAIMTLIVIVITTALTAPEIFNTIRFIKTFFQNAPYADAFAAEKFIQTYKSNTWSAVTGWSSFFIGAIFLIAQLSVYLKMSRSPEKISFSDFLEGMASWFRACIGILYQQFFQMLWTMLFFFPGIVKYYAYSQMFFVLAEFPDVSIPKALTISKRITYGFKADLFMLDLSFLGWYLLSILTGGIAIIWISPYIYMTKTNAYHALMKNALETNVLSKQDLVK